MISSDNDATTRQGEPGRPAPDPDPLRRKIVSSLTAIVDKYRNVLEYHDQVIITIYVDWEKGHTRESVMGVRGRRKLPGQGRK